MLDEEKNKLARMIVGSFEGLNWNTEGLLYDMRSIEEITAEDAALIRGYLDAVSEPLSQIIDIIERLKQETGQ